MAIRIPRPFLSAAAVCLLLVSSGAQAITLGTYNIRYDNAKDVTKGDGWAQRGPVIAQLIRFHGFDIVGTQEGLHHQIDDLQSQMPEYDHIANGRDDGKDAGEHIAIFYRKDKLSVLDHGRFWLSPTPDQPGVGWDAALPRLCAWVRFEETASHRPLYFFSVHFDHRGQEARRQSAALILRRIAEIAGDQPAVLTGDFNVDQNSDSYKVLHDSGLLRDSFDLSPLRLALNGTPNNFDPGARTESRIDHVFVTRQFSVSRYGILTDSYRTAKATDSGEHPSGNFPGEVSFKEYEARLPSDHFPVLIEANF